MYCNKKSGQLEAKTLYAYFIFTSISGCPATATHIDRVSRVAAPCRRAVIAAEADTVTDSRATPSGTACETGQQKYAYCHRDQSRHWSACISYIANTLPVGSVTIEAERAGTPWTQGRRDMNLRPSWPLRLVIRLNAGDPAIGIVGFDADAVVDREAGMTSCEHTLCQSSIQHFPSAQKNSGLQLFQNILPTILLTITAACRASRQLQFRQLAPAQQKSRERRADRR